MPNSELVNCPPDLNEANLVVFKFNSGNGQRLDQTMAGIMVPSEPFVYRYSLVLYKLYCTDEVVVTVSPKRMLLCLLASGYCSDDSDPTPTISGTTGGKFVHCRISDD